jgi:hypothetical protein
VHLHALVFLVDREARDDCRAEPGGDHPLHRAVVVGAEDEPKRLGRCALELPEPSAVLEADQVELGGDGERGLVGLVGVRGQDQHVRVAEDLDVLERPLGERQVGEGQVELAPLDALEQLGVACGLLERHLDAWPRLDEARHQRGEDVLADALVDADVERPREAAAERVHVGLRSRERETIASAWRRRTSPASVSETLRARRAARRASRPRSARASRSAG